MTRSSHEMNRRTFLQMSLAAAAFASQPSGFAEQNSRTPYFGALRPLPPGAVRPEGWLRNTLQKQANELGSHLPEISWPFTEDYWGLQRQGAHFTPEQEYEAWWPWEQKAYWIDGTTRLAILLDDKALLAKATAPVAYTLSHPDSEGYLGPELFQYPLADYHRWPHAVFFRAVAASVDAHQPLHELSQSAVLATLQKHYLGDSVDYGKPKRDVNNIESMLWLYECTGDKRLLEKAETTWREYGKYADDPENADLGLMRVMGDTPINAHGETYAETSKQPAILYLHTGKQQYLDFALADQRRIFDHHMLIDGAPSTSEWFSTRTSLDSHETCDIADHTWSWGYMLQATGDGVWGDRIERAVFNAAPGAIKNDWKALQYLSCPNQVLATLTSDHNWPKFKEHGGSMMAFQPNPGQRTACCGGNVHRIFPNYAVRMWMRTEDHGVAATLYGPSEVKLNLGAENVPVKIVQSTRYPFEEEIHFKVTCDRPVNFPLKLRMPAWCDTPQLTVNNTPQELPPVDKGFITLTRTFHSGDTVALTLPMKIAVSEWPQGGIGLERGPLVYAMPIEADWTSTVVPRYSTAAYPSWEARPRAPWNYGVASDTSDLLTHVSLERVPVTEQEADDPWSHPPLRLRVPAQRIAGWELQVDPTDAKQQFTPPLPQVHTSQVSATVEQISLVPYGSTELRVTIFPRLPRANEPGMRAMSMPASVSDEAEA